MSHNIKTKQKVYGIGESLEGREWNEGELPDEKLESKDKKREAPKYGLEAYA